MNADKNKTPAGLTEGQLNVLETYHRRNLRFLLYQLDDEFRLKPHADANVASLGFLLIELLRASERKPFEMICQGILHAMLREDLHLNPFVAAAMAEMGMTRNKLFEEVLRSMRDDAEKGGRIPFGAQFLGEEGSYTTLWSLRILEVSGREGDHSSIIEPAMKYLTEAADKILEDSPAVVACFMRKLLHFGGDSGRALAEKCLEILLKRQAGSGRWDESAQGLAVDGEVVMGLLEAAPLLGEKAKDAAVRWIREVFILDHDGDLPDWPPILEEGRHSDRPDLWIEGLLKATSAASLYLSMERPDHNPAAYLLALSVPQENILVRAEELIKLAGPYLPRLDEVKSRASQLEGFWEGKAAFAQSVFVMCGTAPSHLQAAIIEAMQETFEKQGLSLRHMAEGGVPYQADPWDNAALYMTGCRYGVALLEGKIETPPAELLYQIGFMRGQGAPVLVLWDKSVQDEGAVAFPGVRAPMTGVEAFGYDPNEQDLASLRKRIEEWASEQSKVPGEGGEGAE
ncbi:MAG: hypothetical protein ACYTG7_13505 [Planctomycetota bacterium]|jgi:hypothetical protein